jgi:hypothetical protein
MWVFQHEVLDHRTLPYFTDRIFRGTGRTNLSLHNYTAFANVLGLPLVKLLGIVRTFNVVYLVLTVLTGFAMFLLARRWTDGDGWVAWLAGVVFAWSPILATRGMGHYSLVAAAPLPVFVLLLMRLHEKPSVRTAVGLGVTVAWATACDVYYGVYCVMVAIAYIAAQAITLERRSLEGRRLLTQALDLLSVCVAGLILALLAGDGWQFAFLGRVVRIRTVYTPLLILTLLLVARVGLQYRPILRPLARERLSFGFRLSAAAIAVAAALMSPLLFAVSQNLQQGQFVRPPILWRSSPPGVDLAAWVVPNPNHPLAPEALREWLAHLSHDGYLENVASVPLVVLGVIGLAIWRRKTVPVIPFALAVGFGLLALGPFVRVAGLDTHVPGPWALLRYVPLIELARSPSRFAIFAMVGVAGLFAWALATLVRQHRRHRLLVLVGITVLLLGELLPAPRVLHSAHIPSIYRTIGDDPRHSASVLELPFGLRDGTMSVGNFTARTQFYQTAHGKPILGGYLSRVARWRMAANEQDPVLSGLTQLSERQPLSPERLRVVAAAWPAFVNRIGIAFVVVDHRRSSDELQTFIESTLKLREIGADGDMRLYAP